MEVKKETLLLTAGIVWMIAGFNVLRLGIIAYVGRVTVLNVILSAVVFGIFYGMIFRNMTKKHTVRILAYPGPRERLWRFFDAKSYAIMIFMMSFGIGLRVSGLAPEVFIAFFYTGLGIALTLAGIDFIAGYVSALKWIQPSVDSSSL